MVFATCIVLIQSGHRYMYCVSQMYESHCAWDYVQCIIRVQFKVGQFMGCHMHAGVRLTGPTGHLA